MPAKDFSELAMVALRLLSFIFNSSLSCIPTMLLQMAQIILLMASVALDSLLVTSNRHRGTVQQISTRVCVRVCACVFIKMMQQGGDNAFLSHIIMM